MDQLEDHQQCTGCGEVLPVTAFGWRDRSGGRANTRCPDCRRAYQQRWYERNGAAHRLRTRQRNQRMYEANRALLDALKDVPCADCGRQFTSEQMDFDHVRGEKLANVGRVGGRWAVERVLAEVAKCDVVCAVCHRIRTAKRAEGPR